MNADANPGRSKFAVWALAVSIVGIVFPPALLGGLVLAILARTEARTARGAIGGQGLVVAAFVIQFAMALVLTVALSIVVLSEPSGGGSVMDLCTSIKFDPDAAKVATVVKVRDAEEGRAGFSCRYQLEARANVRELSFRFAAVDADGKTLFRDHFFVDKQVAGDRWEERVNVRAAPSEVAGLVVTHGGLEDCVERIAWASARAAMNANRREADSPETVLALCREMLGLETQRVPPSRTAPPAAPVEAPPAAPVEAPPADSATPTPAAEAVPRPSFDCATAKTWAARTICSDVTLADKENAMAGAYHARRDAMSDAGKKALAKEQRAWLAERETCESKVDASGCVSQMLDERTAQLRAP